MQKNELSKILAEIHIEIVLFLSSFERVRQKEILASCNEFEKYIFECSCVSQFSRCEIGNVERCALNVGNCLH